MITFHYQLTYDEFYEGARSCTPRTHPVAWVGAIFLAVACVAAIFLAVINPFHAKTEFPWKYVLFMGLAVVAMLPTIWQYGTRFRRAWVKQSQLAMMHKMVVDAEGLCDSWEGTEIKVAWNQIKLWKETARVLVIASNVGYFFLPKRALTAEDLKSFLTLLSEQVIRGTGGFPV